jgi:predicted RNase H-like nuclease (RuvC/YqgF family)
MSSLAQHECQVIAECKELVRKVEAENAELKKQLDAALQKVERLEAKVEGGF